MTIKETEQDAAVREYLSRFGQLPDSRRMTDAAIRALPDLISAALERNSQITDEEAELATDIPEEAAI